MQRKKKITLIVVAGTMGAVLFAALVLLGGICAYHHLWQEDFGDRTTDIGDYEEYLGEDGKYKEHLFLYNDIFPDRIPASAKVEEFYYSYDNPENPCYLGCLVYACEEEDYQREYDRLKKIDSSEEYYIHGATKFPYELCAVYADEDYGYVYAMTDPGKNKFIYVELQFCDSFVDVEYGKRIDEKYLPVGFGG